MQQKTLSLTLLGLAFAAILAMGVTFYRDRWLPPSPSQTTVPEAAPAMLATTSAVTPVNVVLADFAAIATESGPAVVNISTSAASAPESEREQVPEAPEGEPDAGDPFAPFFGPQAPPENEPPAHGMGSGFIIKPDGLILTNAHVVDGAAEVTVKLADRREFLARVIGVDKLTDTAVLKIEAENLPTVRVGKPADTRVGEWVLAIGSPFGFENTVTAGIVSAKSRSLPEEGYVPFIQTDVAVNPGNSGGPLLNIRGEVIGINSQIYSRTGGYQGLSFAIPIDVALNVQQQLVEKGKVSRGRLGLSVQDLTQALAESFGLPKPEGALVGMVSPDGPGAKAEIKPGDIILALNGQAVRDSRELPPRVADLKPGSEATLTVWRDGKSIDIKLSVAELEDKSPVPSAAGTDKADHGRLGLAVRPLTPEEQRVTQVKRGLFVEKAVGPAGKAGIRKGDIVLAVNGQFITDAAELRELAKQAGKFIALLIYRAGNTLFVPIQLD
ncbi:MAG: DegQ family serine endoprotease [Methylococcaceae bacterium]|nr:DegQ family serine endoprotease [Methylococcaceae bacterium]